MQMVRQAALNALLDMLVPTSVIRHRTLPVLRVPTLLPLTHFVQNALLDPTVQLQSKPFYYRLPYFSAYKTEAFPFQNNPKNLDPSYKTDLDI